MVYSKTERYRTCGIRIMNHETISFLLWPGASDVPASATAGADPTVRQMMNRIESDDRVYEPVAMKIGMIMDTSFPPDARVENEARTLMNEGHEVHLFHIDFTPGHQNIPEKDEYEGIMITRMRGSRLLYKLSALAYTLPLFRWLVLPHIAKFIRQTKVDVLHIHDMIIAETAISANCSFRLPVVLDLHENRPEIMKLYKHVNSWPGRWLIRLGTWHRKQKELMKKADQVILVTKEAINWAVDSCRIPREKITAVPNVIRLSDYDAEAKDEEIESMTRSKFTLLYIGDTSLRRGTLTALESVKLLEDQMPDVQLLFVGSGSQDHLLHEFVENHNLDHRVRFEGWQDPSRLPAYVRAADICLSPLLRNIHHDTTYANKLFQYMAGGRPVIASDCPAQADVIRSEACGIIHKAGDAQELVQAIVKLYHDPTARKVMGQRGAYAVRDRWNWELTGENLLGVYRRLFRAGEPEEV